MQKAAEYETWTDGELIERLRGGQQDIMDYIMNKYKFLVRKRANVMFLIGGDTDDLIQEGMIGLFKAIRDYQPEKDASFYYFADLCITRQIYHAVEAARRKKHQPLNGYISLNAQAGPEGRDSLLDLLESMEQGNPEQMLIDRENAAAMREKVKKKLSSMEWQVLQYHLQGMNYRQIAGVMEKGPKAVDNALQRIRGKLMDLSV